MITANSPVITIVISAISLILGLLVAVAATIFNSNWVPDITLGSKTIKTGPGQTSTIRFGILTGPNDAVLASAFISMTSTALFLTGLVLIRHFTRHNGFGWLAFGPALLNLLGQVGCCAAVFILNKRYPAATSTDQIQYVNGKYDTGGQLYTKEAWACSMNALYPDREGSWANQACSRFVSDHHRYVDYERANKFEGNCQNPDRPLGSLRNLSLRPGMLASGGAGRFRLALWSYQ